MPKRHQPRRGIRRKGNQWEAYVMVSGKLLSRRFPLDTPLDELSTWRNRQRSSVDTPDPIGTLGRDAVRYLQTIRHTADYVNKRHYLNRWLKALGRTRARASITSHEIDVVLSGWLTNGCPPDWVPLAPVTVRHHRTALAQVYTTMDKTDASNPVLSTKRPKDPPPEARAPLLADVQKLLAHLRPSKTRARLLVMLTTGLPHKHIMQLQPDHWNRANHRLLVTRRAKGKGAPGRILPLSEAATRALMEFDRWDAWGPFSASGMHRRVRAACLSIKIPPFRPYDLRHLHGTLLYLETGDLATTARLLGHAGTKTAGRYTQAAWLDLDAQAQAKVGAVMETIMETPENTPK